MARTILVLFFLCTLVAAIPLMETPARADFGFLGLIDFGIGSVHCNAGIKGGGNLNVNEARYICVVEPFEILYGCKNHGGNADNANSLNFSVHPASLEKADFGSNFTIQKSGKGTASVTFEDADIANALADVGIVLDPAVLCQNANWEITFVVSKANIYNTIATTPDPNNSCLPNIAAAMTSCDPSVESAVGCTMNECALYKPCVKDHYDLSSPDDYSCTCASHWKNGSLDTNCPPVGQQ